MIPNDMRDQRCAHIRVFKDILDQHADILKKNDDLKLECCYHGDPEYASYKVAGNLLKNNTEMIGDSISLEMLEKGEKMMDESYLYSCSEIGRSLYQRIDTRLAAEKRKSNAEHLHKGLQDFTEVVFI